MDTTLQILEKVNGFYEAAFSQLFALTIATLTLIGVVIPIVVQIIQYKISTKFAKEEIRAATTEIRQEAIADISSTKDALRESVEEKIRDVEKKIFSDAKHEIETLRTELVKSIAGANARSFHLQGNTLVIGKQYSRALVSFVDALEGYFTAKDEVNGLRCLKLSEDCLEKLNKVDYEKDESISDATSRLISALEMNNINQRFFDTIKRIKALDKTAKARSPAPLQPSPAPK